MTYPNDTATSKTGKIYKVGDVVRFKGIEAFSDCVICGFTEDGKYAKLVRPYAYARTITALSPLVGYETIDMYNVDHLADRDFFVTNNRTVS